MDDTRGVIFDIQHFSLHDGPGVRSTVFFKGCPLSCLWCANPESQRHKAELLYFTSLCTRCGHCVEQCPQDALVLDGTGIRLDRRRCVGCGACVDLCPQNARTLSGKTMTVSEIAEEVRQHWRIFMQSGGGVTFGGGEVLAQPAFLGALLRHLHDEVGFHTCIDTSGYAPWPTLEALLPHIDLILLDLKHMDGALHAGATGKPNDWILHNARTLGRRGFPVVVRLPLIPDFNDTESNLDALGTFMNEAGLPSIEVLPYHDFGVSKYEALGKSYQIHSTSKPRLDRAKDILNRYGLDVSVSRE
ncbi:glycyl-radical enzyme activating protein [Telmatospirillum siberiense]|uniref:Glycyl-radical enzyme activating protein n=1 Tax=Telmatospirillum siberiense TaxID=382514 RepID=A0A2N3PNS4_9PROT|nr:glycyl-radical enzyme activating protein [Telmatospirillum siberiense]PKU22059.1 glycyl-radical enzyme activating protein [Telmatospirillum siberiense]